VVADKGYHSGAVVTNLENADVRTYISEKKQPGQRHWEGKAEEHKAVYANRRRVKGTYGKRLLRKRGELIDVFLFSTQDASAPAGEPKCSFSTSKFGSRRNRRYLRYKPQHLKTGNCATGC